MSQDGSSLYNNDDWIMRPEEVAKEIDGENFQLGTDLLIYFKMCSYNQVVIDRIAKTKDYFLSDEIGIDKGFLMLGDPEKIRVAMHKWVDGLIDATIKAKGTTNEQSKT